MTKETRAQLIERLEKFWVSGDSQWENKLEMHTDIMRLIRDNQARERVLVEALVALVKASDEARKLHDDYFSESECELNGHIGMTCAELEVQSILAQQTLDRINSGDWMES